MRIRCADAVCSTGDAALGNAMPGYCATGSVDRAALAGLVAGVEWLETPGSAPERLHRGRAAIENDGDPVAVVVDGGSVDAGVDALVGNLDADFMNDAQIDGALDVELAVEDSEPADADDAGTEEQDAEADVETMTPHDREEAAKDALDRARDLDELLLEKPKIAGLMVGRGRAYGLVHGAHYDLDSTKEERMWERLGYRLTLPNMKEVSEDDYPNHILLPSGVTYRRSSRVCSAHVEVDASAT